MIFQYFNIRIITFSWDLIVKIITFKYYIFIFDMIFVFFYNIYCEDSFTRLYIYIYRKINLQIITVKNNFKKKRGGKLCTEY